MLSEGPVELFSLDPYNLRSLVMDKQFHEKKTLFNKQHMTMCWIQSRLKLDYSCLVNLLTAPF